MGAAFTAGGLATYLLARKIARNPWKALLYTLAIFLGTMLWPYSAVFYGHVPAAGSLAAALYLLVCAREEGNAALSRRWLWIGVSTGLAFIMDHTSAFVIVGLGVYALYVLRSLDNSARIRALGAGAAGTLITLLPFLAYNLSVYGTPLAFGYAYEAEDRFQEIMGLGLMGIRVPTIGAAYHITFDPKFGLFWLSPVLLMAPVGYLISFKMRRNRAECLLSIYAVGVMLAMNAASYLWWGGNAFGPRLVISALPFVIIPMAMLPDAFTWPVGILGLMSAANMLIPLVGQIQYTRLEYKPDRGGFYVAEAPFRGFSLLYDYGVPQIMRQLQAGKPSWTLGAALGLPYWSSVPALVVAQCGLLSRFRPAGQGRGCARSRRFGSRGPRGFDPGESRPTEGLLNLRRAVRLQRMDPVFPGADETECPTTQANVPPDSLAGSGNEHAGYP